MPNNRGGGLVVVANEILVSAQGPLVLCFGLKGLGPGLKKISKSMLMFPKSKPPSFKSKIQRQRNLNVEMWTHANTPSHHSRSKFLSNPEFQELVSSNFRKRMNIHPFQGQGVVLKIIVTYEIKFI